MRVHLLVELTPGEGAEPRTVKDVRNELVDHVERTTLWVGGPLSGEAQGADPYDVTVLSFGVEQP